MKRKELNQIRVFTEHDRWYCYLLVHCPLANGEPKDIFDCRKCPYFDGRGTDDKGGYVWCAFK